jgi:tripartite ATP-independent transporter DctM subunit
MNNLFLKIEQSLVSVVEYFAALLVFADICILLAGVISRFVFKQPLTWSDELASIIFLWSAMLGSVIAVKRAEHMRMTAFVSMCKDNAAAFFEAFQYCAGLLFLIVLFLPAYQHAIDEAIVITPSLEISGLWREAALPVGIALMSIYSIVRLIQLPRLLQTAQAVALTLVTVLLFYKAQFVFENLGAWNLLIFFVLVVLSAVFAGVPIGFSFGLGVLGYLGFTTSTPISVIVGRMNEGMSHQILLAVPLFVFLGLLMEMSGMARSMVAFLESLLGHVRGGLSYVLIGAMYLVSGISGSKAADMAAVTPALFPEMKKRGADEGELVALLAATGAQTETVPPSLVLITIGSVTGVSIAGLFTGGLLPALVLALMLAAVVAWRTRYDHSQVLPRATYTAISKSFVFALPALALPFIIRFAVVQGVATATEVSTIGIVYCALAGIIIYKQWSWSRLTPMLIETASLSGSILFIIGTATAMAWGLTQSGFSGWLASTMQSLPGGAPVFLCVSIAAFVILGSVLEGIPAIVLLGPLLFPIARQLGIHEVHYAMVVVLSMGLGLFAPPLGVGYYAACAIGRVEPSLGIRPILPYMGALFVGIVLIAFVPWFSIGAL